MLKKINFKEGTMAKKIRLNGRDVYIPDSVVTAEQILADAHINPNNNLVHVRPDGNFLIPKNRPVDINEGSAFIDLPPRVKG